MEDILLSEQEARRVILNAAGLAHRGQFGTGPEAVYQVINHLGFVQLDTNYVVERAHHQVMAARIPDYEPQWLNNLVEDSRIFEFFISEAGYLPMHDFRFSLPLKDSFAINRKPLLPAEKTMMKQVLDRIEREGPLMVSDFEQDRLQASTGWWDWRPAKVALERLYLDGKLMITRTKGFQKIYDLPLNLVPPETDTTPPTAQQYARYMIRRTLGALGIASAKEILWRARFVKNNLIKTELECMLAEGELKQVSIENLKTKPLYRLAKQAYDLQLAGDVFIISPFDILNVFRNRLKEFFKFNYQIECFVPAPKRKYGYFSLPILAGDTFIARMDAKADRKNKRLMIHNIHFEDVTLEDSVIVKLAEALKDYIIFNQCNDVAFTKTNQPEYLKAISRHF
jgi:uncharacterized protein YcaQ